MRRGSPARETVSEPPPRIEYFSDDDDGGYEVDVDDFRSRVGFLCMLGVAFTGGVYLMTLLRTVLEPFMWALFLVIALHPLAMLFENCLLCVGQCICRFRLRPAPEHRRCPLREREGDDFELQGMAEGSASAGPAGSGGEVGGEQLWRIGFRGHFCQCFSRVVAVSCALAVVFGIMGALAMFIFEAALQLKEDLHIYETGAKQTIQKTELFLKRISADVSKQVVDKVLENLLSSAKVILSSLLAQLLEHTGKFLVGGLMLGLYVMFWLCTPMPLNTHTERIFRRYLFLKGGACICYGVCVGLMLNFLKVNMAPVFGLLSFMFAFVPEIGAFVAMAIPMPVILFDSRLNAPFFTLFMATAGQLCLKFVFSNIIEVKLVENDSTMKMHPVITLLAVTFFGVIWGPTGMLLSVPMMTYLKVVILSDKIPAAYRDPVLVLLEGDRRAPHRLRQRHAKKRADRGHPGNWTPRSDLIR